MHFYILGQKKWLPHFLLWKYKEKDDLWDGGTKVCANVSGHMTKMAAMPLYGKNFKKIFFSGIKRSMTLKLGMQHRVLEFAQMMTLS